MFLGLVYFSSDFYTKIKRTGIKHTENTGKICRKKELKFRFNIILRSCFSSNGPAIVSISYHSLFSVYLQDFFFNQRKDTCIHLGMNSDGDGHPWLAGEGTDEANPRRTSPIQMA